MLLLQGGFNLRGNDEQKGLNEGWELVFRLPITAAD
jgi:hypothetical protein